MYMYSFLLLFIIIFQGETFDCPERVPFRLTHNIVNAMVSKRLSEVCLVCNLFKKQVVLISFIIMYSRRPVGSVVYKRRAWQKMHHFSKKIIELEPNCKLK